MTSAWLMHTLDARGAAVAGGLGMLMASLLWRSVHRLRVHRALRRSLRDPDPAARAAAVSVAAEFALRRYAPLLLRMSRGDCSPLVVGILRDAVLRNTWEPNDDPVVLRLRIWAHTVLPPTLSIPLPPSRAGSPVPPRRRRGRRRRPRLRSKQLGRQP